MFHRLVLDELGYEQVPIYNPNQDASFYQQLGLVGDGFVRHTWQAVLAVDALDQLRREIRPYEINPGETDAVYQEGLDKLCRAILKGKLFEAVHEAKLRLSQVKTDRTRSRPIIGVVGEIFVRANRFCNHDLARQIERLGGEAWFSPVSEWFLYLNYTGVRQSLARKDYANLLHLMLTDWVQRWDEHRMQRLFKDKLRNAHEPRIKTTLKYSLPYLHPTFEGEAVLSVGKSVDFAKKGLAGIVNTMPFTCMPGTIVTAITKKFREDYHHIPYLNIALDGLEQSNTITRLEAFMYQAHQYAAASQKNK